MSYRKLFDGTWEIVDENEPIAVVGSEREARSFIAGFIREEDDALDEAEYAIAE